MNDMHVAHVFVVGPFLRQGNVLIFDEAHNLLEVREG